MSTFESCPAATGVPVLSKRCSNYGDGAHRCRFARALHHVHACHCGYQWISATPQTVEPDDVHQATAAEATRRTP